MNADRIPLKASPIHKPPLFTFNAPLESSSSMSSKDRGAFLEPFSAEDNNAEMGIMSEFLPPRLNGSGVGAPLTEG